MTESKLRISSGKRAAALRVDHEGSKGRCLKDENVVPRSAEILNGRERDGSLLLHSSLRISPDRSRQIGEEACAILEPGIELTGKWRADRRGCTADRDCLDDLLTCGPKSHTGPTSLNIAIQEKSGASCVDAEHASWLSPLWAESGAQRLVTLKNELRGTI